MNQRRNFLKTACKPIVLATLGIPLLQACSTEDESLENTAIEGLLGSAPNEPLKLDLSSGSFAALLEVGGWLNYSAKNILLVRISESEVRVFDNKCPHQGNRDKWSYDGSKFTCGHHNNSYSDTCSGSLTCYKASLDGTTLTITF